MDIKEKLLLGLGESFTKFALNCAVAGTYVVLEHLAKDITDVFDLGKLGRVPIVQKLRAFLDDMPMHAGVTRVRSIVECVRV